MKHFLKTTCVLVITIILANTGIQAQETNSSSGLGIGLKASTNGLGADVIYSISPQIAARLGFEKFTYSTNIPFEEQGISYDADVTFSTGSISLLADFYLLKWFFISVGAGYNLFELTLDGRASKPFPFGDIEIPIDRIGDFFMQVNPTYKISPYAGIGFGRTIGFNKNLGLAFELGTYFQGAPDLTIESSGLLSPTSNPDHGQELRLENHISQYTMYPVVRLSINYKILSF